MHSLYFNLSNSDSTLFIIDKTNTGLKDLNCGILKFMQLSCHFAQERTILKTSFMELPCHSAQKRTFSKQKTWNFSAILHRKEPFLEQNTWNVSAILHRKEPLKKINGTSLPLCTEKNTSQNLDVTFLPFCTESPFVFCTSI